MATDESYRNDAQQRLMAAWGVLLEEPLHGVGATELASAIDASQPQTFRTLKNLELAGWAEQTAMGTWRPTMEAQRASDRFRRVLGDMLTQLNADP